MALFDPMLLDSLLETVMLQDIWLANRTDGITGTGTKFDPFSCGGAEGDADPRFDQIMRAILALPNPPSVHLLPGTYYTNGFNPDYSSNIGWRPRSGMRIVGSSLKNTTLSLTNSARAFATKLTLAVGLNHAVTGHFLDGFELSDITIDCRYHAMATVSAVGGIGVTGKHVYVRRVRVTNFGSKTGSYPSFGISIARSDASNPIIVENCVADSCQVDTPSAASGGLVYGIYLARESGNILHKYTVVRNCLVDMGNFSNEAYHGMVVGGGHGTIIEHNRIVRAYRAFSLFKSTITSDLIIRSNYTYDVPNVLQFDLASEVSGGSIDRLVFMNHTGGWPTTGSYGSGCRGVYLVGPASPAAFKELIIRDNVFRRSDDSTSSSDIGIEVGSWGKAILDNNVIDVATINNGVRHSNNTLPPNTFNNLKNDGTRLLGYNTGTSTRDQDLSTEVEDITLAL